MKPKPIGDGTIESILEMQVFLMSIHGSLLFFL